MIFESTIALLYLWPNISSLYHHQIITISSLYHHYIITISSLYHHYIIILSYRELISKERYSWDITQRYLGLLKIVYWIQYGFNIYSCHTYPHKIYIIYIILRSYIIIMYTIIIPYITIRVVVVPTVFVIHVQIFFIN